MQYNKTIKMKKVILLRKCNFTKLKNIYICDIVLNEERVEKLYLTNVANKGVLYYLYCIENQHFYIILSCIMPVFI